MAKVLWYTWASKPEDQDEYSMRQELDIYIRARYPLLYVVTAEEERALAEIQKLADESKTRKQVIAWSCTEGFVNQASGRK
ncbi:MAG: hypothetical protein WA029_05580, partial [Anaerolineae bacterium]